MELNDATRLIKATQLMLLGKDNQPISDLYYALQTAVDSIEELQERREADRWISVKDRMPEPRVAVMVYCPEHKNQYCAFYEDKHWQVFGAYDTVWHEVTHWRPLPQKPNESEDK